MAHQKDGKKPPRTVHIDVYCTGSDGEGDTSSDSSMYDNRIEDESVSTPQTVFESQEMRLQHTRVRPSRSDLPRRLNPNPITGTIKKSLRKTKQEIL